MLRAKKPELIKKRLKAMFYGEAGAGKSLAACSFPSPYYIDCEKGTEHTQYVNLLNAQGGVVFSCQDFFEVTREVRALMTTPHQYKTLVIDPVTVLYDHLVETYELKNQHSIGYNKAYTEANRAIKNFTNLLLRLDMNVILCCRSKVKYIGAMIDAGTTFDCAKSLPYIVDLSLEVKKSGDKREAIVQKSRLEGFKEGEIIPFSYKEIATRYDIETIERAPVAPPLLDSFQLIFLENEIEKNEALALRLDKWLKDRSYDSLKEITFEEAKAIIEYINKAKGEL